MSLVFAIFSVAFVLGWATVSVREFLEGSLVTGVLAGVVSFGYLALFVLALELT